MLDNTGSVEDRLAIRELIESYSEAVMVNDPDAWIANWCEDSRWDLAEGGEIVGRDAILDHWKTAMAVFDFCAMFSMPASIRVDGDDATGRWYTNELCRKADGDMLRIVGHYRDKYRRTGDGWRIVERKYKILFMQSPVFEEAPESWR